MYLGLGFNYFFLSTSRSRLVLHLRSGADPTWNKSLWPSTPSGSPVASPPVRLPPKSPSLRPISQREPQIGAVSTTKAAWGGLSFLDCGKFRALGESGTFRAAISGLTGPP